jgi:hypothetical protein
MSAAIEYTPQTGTLVAPQPVLEALLGGGPVDEPELVSAGVLEQDGTAHPALRWSLDAIAGARVALVMERGERRGYGWVGPHGHTALVLPHPDGRRRLMSVRTQFVPDALVRVNGLGPRPRVEPAVRIRLSVPDLAAALATRDASAAQVDEPEALRGLLAALREHWRVEARWEPADGSTGVRAVEVLDTEEGVWMVVPDDPSVELWPSTPTAVFRAICGLLPFDHEVET